MEIQLSGLVKSYQSEGRTVRALDGIDLHIPANQIFTLLGPSGCGKTTLLRCIVGLETPDEGEIRIGDQIVWSHSKRISVPPEKRGLGMVFQTYAIWPHMSVFDNVAYPLQVRGTDRATTRNKVRQALQFVQLENLENRPATRLSGGQQQRVALARALVAEPKVILFDEPLSNLDAKLREETRKILRRFLIELGITAVYVTHDRVEALALSDSIAVLNGGRIIERGTPQKNLFQCRSPLCGGFHRPGQPDCCHSAAAGSRVYNGAVRVGHPTLPEARLRGRGRGHSVHPARVSPALSAG
jgi:iron(III) transport system ATP-binding protein